MISSKATSHSEKIEIVKILQQEFESLEKEQLEIGRQQAALSRKQIELALKCGAIASAMSQIIRGDLK